MYKLLIADDEEWIRDGLKTFVDWKTMGFTVVGEAEDGEQALEMVDKLSPHVVLTDIRMPFMTGIELMEKVRQFDRSIKFIILSGYDEFTYAHAAIDSGASGYLLKPINVDKLKEVFGKVKREFDEYRKEETKKTRAYQLLRERFIAKLVQGNAEIKHDLAELANEAGVQIVDRGFAVLLVELDDMRRISEKYTSNDQELLQYALKNIAEELFRDECEVYFFDWNQPSFGMLLAWDAGAAVRPDEIAERYIAMTVDSIKLKITVYSGSKADDAFQIKRSYDSALLLSEMKFFYGKNRLISEASARAFQQARNESPAPVQAERLISIVQEAELLPLQEYVDATFDGVSAIEDVIETYAQIMKVATKLKKKFHPLLASVQIAKEQDYYKIPEFETLEELKSAVVLTFRDMIRALAASRTQPQNRIIDELISYMENRCAEEITLEKAAELVFMHPIYVSRLFKKETGKNFIDYLTEIRIAKAKQLLGDFSLKIYAVSDMVGYNDPKHFSKVFKQAVGVTPREYRKLVLGYMDDLFET